MHPAEDDIEKELRLRAIAKRHFEDSTFEGSSEITAEVARIAAEQERLDVLTRVFAAGFNPSHEYTDGANLMHYALAPEVVRFLLSHGVSATKIDKKGETPLHQVSASSHPQAELVARLLLEAGADTHMPDNEGRTPLDNAESIANACGDASIYRVLRSHSDENMMKHGAKGCLVMTVLLAIAAYVIFRLVT